MILGRVVSILLSIVSLLALLLAYAELSLHPSDALTAFQTELSGLTLVLIAITCLTGWAVLTLLVHIAGSLDRRARSESHESVLSESREHAGAGSAR